MTLPYSPEDPLKYWAYRYDNGNTEWHMGHVNPFLVKHYEKLNPGDRAQKVLVTMCGMSVDMNWLAEKGLEVIGVDIALQALKNFIAESGQQWTETAAPKLGPDAKLFTRHDGKIKLYWGDALSFSRELEGGFDAVYDCDGLHVLDGGKTPKFAEMIKNVLNPGGIFLLQATAYDLKILEDKDFKPPLPVPPPYSMNVNDMKRLFESHCTVDHVDTHTNTLLYGKPSDFNTYLIIKK